ncbi:MAG: hypothetical protein FWC20_01830 [Oscillospiraceae bacterium]|nr:hypothetical protein [Oscillospiraceae bacterium]MCL2278132.1 hypothetical protein [Oscillospiraceae bacterium]
MSKPLVSVQYQNKKNSDEYDGREYTYFAGIDLAVGDLVIAPVGNSESVAKVSAVNVPESKVDERWMSKLKTIDKLYVPKSEERAIETEEIRAEDL